jgi:hypothetical protein
VLPTTSHNVVFADSTYSEMTKTALVTRTFSRRAVRDLNYEFAELECLVDG